MHILLIMLSLDATAKPASSEAAGDNTWINELRLADERLDGLVDAWRSGQAGNAVQDSAYVDWLRKMSDLKYQLSVLTIERDIKREALADAAQRLRDGEYGQRRCEEREQGFQEDLGETEAELARRVEAAMTALAEGGLNERAARRALERWWGLWTALELQDAVQREDGLDALVAARLDLQRAAPGLEATRPALEAVLAASDQVLDLYGQQRDERSRCEQIGTDGLAQMVDRIRGDLLSLDAELAEKAAEIAELERRRPAEQSLRSDAFLTEARTVSAAYEEARGRLDSTDSPIDHVQWCRIHVNGAMALMLAGDNRSDLFLHGAASAWDDSCVEYVARWADISMFQQQWAGAQREVTGLGMASILVNFVNNASWTIDGIEVDKVGWEKFELRPGPHRLEFVPDTGRRKPKYVELVAGQRYAVWMEEGQIELGLEDQVPQSRRTGVEDRDDDDGDDGDDDIKDSVEPPLTRWSLTAGPSWVHFDGLDHIGGNLNIARPLNDGDRIVLELALNHEMTRGERDYWYTTNLDSRFLFRERLSFAVARPLDHRLQPRAELSVGVIPFNAFLYGAHLGADWRVAQTAEGRTYIRILANAGKAIWANRSTPWDLSLSAGFGVHL